MTAQNTQIEPFEVEIDLKAAIQIAYKQEAWGDRCTYVARYKGISKPFGFPGQSKRCAQLSNDNHVTKITWLPGVDTVQWEAFYSIGD